ncbi:hypothetical protein [Halopiger aswanensis]|nr:hypothetical protein [Halopiger aswanensis]
MSRSDFRQWNTDPYEVMMGHNFLDGRLALEQLLETPIEYI